MANLNIAKFEWENEIPFSADVVKRTIQALIGESAESNRMIRGLLDKNPTNQKWGLNSVNPESNITFGTFTLNQVNSKFSITVAPSGENSHIKITVTGRTGSAYTSPSYYQGECDKFTKALAYYLGHQDEVDYYYNESKPQQTEYINDSSNSGCMVVLPFIGGVMGYITYLMM